MNVTPLAIEKLKEVMTAEDEAGSALRVVAMPAGQGLAVHADHGEGAPA